MKFSKKKKKHKKKGFQGFFFLYIHLLRFVHLIQKADGLLLAFLGFPGLIKSLSFLEKELNYIEGLSKITLKAARLNHAAQ